MVLITGATGNVVRGAYGEAKTRAIGRAIGKHLEWQEVPADQIRQSMLARGLPADVPDRMPGHLADAVERPGPSSDTVQKI